MATNVEQEEVDALLGSSEEEPSSEVEARDFARPQRLSAEERELLVKGIRAALPHANAALTEVFSQPARLDLASLSEAHADHLFADAPEPLAVLRFLINGQPSWVRWELLPAIRSIETLLGSSGATTEARPLSPIEARVMEYILLSALEPLFTVLDVKPEQLAVVQERTELGGWSDVPGGDPHRVVVETTLEGIGEPSSLHVYLGGLGVGTRETGPHAALPAQVPGNLRDVEVELSACLEGGEIPLAQLLALEEGDVITLEARLGDGVELRVEDQTIGHADWGQSDGQSAVRLRSRPETNEEPS